MARCMIAVTAERLVRLPIDSRRDDAAWFDLAEAFIARCGDTGEYPWDMWIEDSATSDVIVGWDDYMWGNAE